MTLHTLFSESERPYSGPELAPHFILKTFRLRGSALVCFEGPCRVETQDLVDYEDSLVGDSIQAARMLHFLGEFFGVGLREAVWAQRLFIAQAFEELLALGVPSDRLRRSGDDLFVGDAKLSVSIVTVSPVSALLHAALNIDPAGAPVRAVGLETLRVNPRVLGQKLLSRFAQEWESVEMATTKVRPLGSPS